MRRTFFGGADVNKTLQAALDSPERVFDERYVKDFQQNHDVQAAAFYLKPGLFT